MAQSLCAVGHGNNSVAIRFKESSGPFPKIGIVLDQKDRHARRHCRGRNVQ
jgi:hypothetical protein